MNKSSLLVLSVLIRNQKGYAQPMIFAPLLGTKESYLPIHKNYSFQFRLFLYQGRQPDAFRYAAQNVSGFKDYRENSFVNLNKTIENTIDFAMNDVYCGWNPDLRGFDYSTDVQKTVKVVSALHPLSLAIVTDNESIYQRRALPMTEFLMSRQKYLDYPLRAFNQISYNQVYYNHVWPQIALLLDYLVSDVYASSNGKINFPAQYAPGYAYLKSHVYGDQPGTFYGDDSVYLWMPKQVLTIDNEQLNYVTGYGNGKFYIALLNQSDQPVKATVSCNPDLVPLNGINSMRIRTQNGPPSTSELAAGKLHIAVAAKGITAIAIDDVHIVTRFQQYAYHKEDKTLSDHSYKSIDSPLGRIPSAIYSLGKLNSSYTWLEADAGQLNKATLYYRISGASGFQALEDGSYPFEFTIPLKAQDEGLEWWIEGIAPGGKRIQSDTITIKK